MGQLTVASIGTTGGRTSRVPALHWVLLVWTLLGLAAMHTIGHVGACTAMAIPDPPGVQRLPAAAMTLTAHVAHMATMDAATLGDRGVRVGDGLPAGGHPDGWSVCLAILVALAVAVLVGWLLGAATAAGGRVRALNLRRIAPRAPPVSGVGLRLADLSVLRR